MLHVFQNGGIHSRGEPEKPHISGFFNSYPISLDNTFLKGIWLHPARKRATFARAKLELLKGIP
jgi:hypothetical protein